MALPVQESRFSWNSVGPCAYSPQALFLFPWGTNSENWCHFGRKKQWFSPAKMVSFVQGQLLPTTTVLDLVMNAPIQLQCIFSYTIQANSETEPHTPYTYQSKLIPGGSINLTVVDLKKYLR